MQENDSGARDDACPVMAIETSTEILGVSVVLGERILFEEAEVRPQTHASLLLPLCLEALESTGMRLSDLSAVAASKGPGSFTGLRIGCATAQGLALAAGIPVVMVPTFQVLLRQCSSYQSVALVQGMAKAQTVTAFYIKGGSVEGDADLASAREGQGRIPGLYGFKEVLPPAARELDEFLKECLKFSSSRVMVAGDAALLAEGIALEGLGGSPGPGIAAVDEDKRLPRPGTVGLIASAMLKEGKAVEPGLAIPMYIRKSQARIGR